MTASWKIEFQFRLEGVRMRSELTRKIGKEETIYKMCTGCLLETDCRQFAVTRPRMEGAKIPILKSRISQIFSGLLKSPLFQAPSFLLNCG